MDTVSCSIDTIWLQASEKLIARLGAPVFQMWFDPKTVLPRAIDEEEFTLGFPKGSFMEWAENYRNDIAEALLAVTGKQLKIRFVEMDAAETTHQEKDEKSTRSNATVANGTKSRTPRPRRVATATATPAPAVPSAEQMAVLNRLNRLYSFDTFVVGETNRFAYNACMQAALNPGMGNNPLFIHGASGLGKTHLLQSIAREVCKHNPKATVEYMTSEQFGNLYVEACLNKSRTGMSDFRNHFRHVDVLLIDDVQFFGGREGMQEEFFHTFNALNDDHKQIVLASDRTPQELPGLSSRLVSRFQGGLTVDITPPDLDMRVAILQRKQQSFDQKFSDEILRYLAGRIKSNVRNLESSLFTLYSFLTMPPATNLDEVTFAKVDQIVGGKFEEDAAQQVSVNRIMETVAHRFDVRIQDIKGKSRVAEIIMPRQIAMFLARRLTDKSLPAIADTFNRTHPTVVHSIDAVEERMASSDSFRQVVADLERQLCAR